MYPVPACPAPPSKFNNLAKRVLACCGCFLLLCHFCATLFGGLGLFPSQEFADLGGRFVLLVGVVPGLELRQEKGGRPKGKKSRYTGRRSKNL